MANPKGNTRCLTQPKDGGAEARSKKDILHSGMAFEKGP